MKEKVCCIYDSDEKYAVRLTEYINEKRLLPYKAMAFTEAEALENSLREYSVELILAGSDYEPTDDEPGERLVRLVESRELAGERAIFRYQPADDLIRDVLGCIPGLSRMKPDRQRTTRIYGVYSPAGNCCKTTLALAFALYSASKSRTLYINFEQFSGLLELLADHRGGLSDALYYYRLGGDNALGKIMSCIEELKGLHYLAPAVCAEDISESDYSAFGDFVNMLADSGNYDVIVLDIGCMINRPWKVLEICDGIYMPEPFGGMGKNKCNEFEKYMLLAGHKEIMDKLQRVRIPYDENYADTCISLGCIESNTMQMVAGRYMNG